MKSPYVNELEPNQVIQTSFLVHSKEIRQKKGGEFYLSLLLADRTGELDAKMWDNVAEVLDAFDRDDFVKVKGLIQVFHNRPQMTIHKLRRMDDSEIDFVDYFPSSRRDPDEMWARIARDGGRHPQSAFEGAARRHAGRPGDRGAIPPRAGRQADSSRLSRRIARARAVALRRWPAPPRRIIRTCDCDLLLTGVVLHDIGKIYELNYERGFSYSNEGQLLGHIHIGVRMVAEKLRGLPDFPPALRSLVEHMILSHHGAARIRIAQGSRSFPRRCCSTTWTISIPRWSACARLIENDRQVEGCFTSYHQALSRSALKKDRFLRGKPEPAPPPAGRQSLRGRRRPRSRRGRPWPRRHPLFAPKPDSPFADKLKQALQPAGPKQDS